MAALKEVLKKAQKEVASSKKKGTYVGFKALAAKTSPAKTSPDIAPDIAPAIAAAIGRKKYGAKGMAALAAAGKAKKKK